MTEKYLISVHFFSRFIFQSHHAGTWCGARMHLILHGLFFRWWPGGFWGIRYSPGAQTLGCWDAWQVQWNQFWLCVLEGDYKLLLTYSEWQHAQSLLLLSVPVPHRNQVRYAFSALYEIQQTDTNHLMGIDSYKEPPILQIYIAEYISIQIHSMWHNDFKLNLLIHFISLIRCMSSSETSRISFVWAIWWFPRRICFSNRSSLLVQFLLHVWPLIATGFSLS